MMGDTPDDNSSHDICSITVQDENESTPQPDDDIEAWLNEEYGDTGFDAEQGMAPFLLSSPSRDFYQMSALDYDQDGDFMWDYDEIDLRLPMRSSSMGALPGSARSRIPVKKPKPEDLKKEDEKTKASPKPSKIPLFAANGSRELTRATRSPNSRPMRMSSPSPNTNIPRPMLPLPAKNGHKGLSSLPGREAHSASLLPNKMNKFTKKEPSRLSQGKIK